MIQKGKSYSFVVTGDPSPLSRIRHTRGSLFDSYKIAQERFKEEIQEAFDGKKKIVGAVALEVTFLMPMPSSWPPIKKKEMMGLPHIMKPNSCDILNFVTECGQFLLYDEDCVIYKVEMNKLYEDEEGPRTIFTITECIYNRLDQRWKNNRKDREEILNDKKI
jgi:hypothetical protein